jgi:ABC-type glycerol-3-phosphate transport system permease component
MMLAPLRSTSVQVIGVRRGKDVARQAILYALLTLLALIYLTPLAWMLSTALKDNSQMSAWPPVWIPNPIRWDNFVQATVAGTFDVYLKNTLIITLLAMVGQLISATAVAYGFARLRFPGRDFLFVIVLATMMLPGVVTLIPTFVLFKLLGWLDTFAPPPK